MKTRAFVSILIFVLAVLIVVGSCATGKKAVKAPIESLYGKLENPHYNKSDKKRAKLARARRNLWV